MMVMMAMVMMMLVVMMKTMTRQNFQSPALQHNRVGNAGAEAYGCHGDDDDYDGMTVKYNFQSTVLADNRVGDAGAKADPASLSAEAGKRTGPCQFPARGQHLYSENSLCRKCG